MACCLSILSLLSPDEAEEELPDKQYHKFKDIVKDADDKSDLLQRVHSGIYLNKKEMKYWVDESGSNCFMIFARSLQIAWSQEKQYWNWMPSNDSGNEDVEVACLKAVCWLEVAGDFDVSLLSPNVNYEVGFILTMKEFSQGWEQSTVSLKLGRPDNSEQEEEIFLDPEEFKGQWRDLVVGEFNSRDSTGRVTFVLIGGGHWWGGLVVKGAVLRPVKPGFS
ncbi:Protein PHLOEM PROTEIN 2-LIKE A1 [Acorus calamus]|uniref:Protein PHLOEM PROTEIN 2-LIKE A1 n=1 Tax=Acorus calamus TaxID=4465 RepID=A0AAV9D8R5_ACOCL|nr:Protein PHLOEM PROTEIN 2-LIKE A1 [Acorus calamus]